MALYEYECPKCGRFDAFQKMSDAPLCQKSGCIDPACPRAAKRLISAPALCFRGTGFFCTDYRTRPPAEKKD